VKPSSSLTFIVPGCIPYFEENMSYLVTVRYGALSFKGDFKTTLTDLVEGGEVVLRTDRGTELGRVLASPFEVPDEKKSSAGDVLRRLNDQDREVLARINDEQLQTELRACREKIREHNLPMKLVNVEHLLGGEKIIYYFVADGRVDFRELVKDLAREYRTRIELKQVGVRDEARMLADLDHCGREICCRSWMRNLEPVTMRMAKAQKATLDPAKISGRCGRLMCCLRFEDGVYEELKKNLPRKGQRVVTDAGTAEVITYDILSQTMMVEYPDERRMKVHLSEVKEVLPKEPKSERGNSGRGGGRRNRTQNADRSRNRKPAQNPAAKKPSVPAENDQGAPDDVSETTDSSANAQTRDNPTTPEEGTES